MGDRLADGNVAVALLANSIATGTVLSVLILVFGPVSGAHFNPAVTLVMALDRAMPWREVLPYIAVQIAAAFAGVAAAHLMFEEAVFSISLKGRAGPAQWWSEAVATFGLVAVIAACVRTRPPAVAYAVGAYITGAYWFTASTSFANPAVTLARAATDSFAGIRAADVPPFLIAQIVGALAALAAIRYVTTSRSGR